MFFAVDDVTVVSYDNNLVVASVALLLLCCSTSFMSPCHMLRICTSDLCVEFNYAAFTPAMSEPGHRIAPIARFLSDEEPPHLPAFESVLEVLNVSYLSQHHIVRHMRHVP